jgi:D-methionine transport system permease protein
MSFNDLLPLLTVAFLETLYMTVGSLILATLLGAPYGMLLFITQKSGMAERLILNHTLNIIANIVRSIPFIILLVAIIPFTRFVVGTSIGTNAAMVPLVIGAIPFIARIVENALHEIPKGLIETGEAMGATVPQILFHFLLPEALPNIIKGLTITTIALVSYSAMAGAVGGGGLGDLAIRYGYQRFEVSVMLATVIVLVILVQILQWLGDAIARKYDHR